jgi:hypothetical protein
MLRSVNPYLCPIFGVRSQQAEARIGDPEFMFSLMFGKQGIAFSILEFLPFAKISVLV